MSSYKVERARKVFQNLGSPSGEATRLAHVAEQAWSLCIRMNSGKLEEAPINMSLRDLAAIYGASNQSDGSTYDFRTKGEIEEEKLPVSEEVLDYIKQQGWAE
jgi:hypothetical protein